MINFMCITSLLSQYFILHFSKEKYTARPILTIQFNDGLRISIDLHGLHLSRELSTILNILGESVQLGCYTLCLTVN